MGISNRTNSAAQHAPSQDSAAVRRSSGGGAILHDRELTYSLIVPGEEALGDDSTWLYTAVHQALIETLAGFGIEAILFEQSGQQGGLEQPFLCFQRRTAGDVVLGGAKSAEALSAAGAEPCCSTAA